MVTNGWDRTARRDAAEESGPNGEEFQDWHETVIAEFETGRLSLDDYLRRTIFYRPRAYRPAAFADFMRAQSHAHPEVLELAASLSGSRTLLQATLNNESLELNQQRIESFGLRRHFSLFLSSYYLGLKKPDEAIFRLALDVTQRAPEACLFTDDRELNLECAGLLGLRTIHYRDPAQLRRELIAHEVPAA